MEELARRKYQRDFSLFKGRIFKRYRRAQHLDHLDWALMEVSKYAATEGKEGIGFLVSEFPPRHGKTLSLFRLFPPWHLGSHPDHRIMGVSYGATLAYKNSRLARNLMLSPWYQGIFPDIRLDPSHAAADAWDIDGYEGGMDALGVLGGATGKGANILICDDLIKNREEAESEVIRERTWDGLIDDLLTRLEPGGAIILNGTRWHQDDPIGRALDRLKHLKPYRLRFPAIAEENDLLGRRAGEALWPERYPIERLRDIETTMGPYSWSALYQQNPVPAEGGIFKRKWFEQKIDLSQLPAIVRAVRFWDLAMSEKTSADYTVGTQMVECEDGHLYIVDVSRGQMEWGDVTPHLADTMLADGPSVTQGIEEKGFMSRAVTDLNMDHRLRGYQVWGYPKDTDKLTNALPFAAKCAAGVVHLVKAHWNAAWIDEVCSFPNGTHDDQLDSAAGAYNMLTDGAGAEFGEIAHADDSTIGAWWGG